MIERANAFILYNRGVSAHVQDDNQKLGYLVRAHESVLRALHTNPDSSSLNMLEAEILAMESALLQRLKHSDWQDVYVRARQAYIKAKGPRAKLGLARLLMRRSLGSEYDREIENLFLQALEEDSCHVDALRLYSDFLVERNQTRLAEEFLERRRKIIQGEAVGWKESIVRSASAMELLK